MFMGNTAGQNDAETEIIVVSNEISTSLPELVGKVTRSLYEIFDFFCPSIEMIQRDLARMRSGHN